MNDTPTFDNLPALWLDITRVSAADTVMFKAVSDAPWREVARLEPGGKPTRITFYDDNDMTIMVVDAEAGDVVVGVNYTPTSAMQAVLALLAQLVSREALP